MFVNSQWNWQPEETCFGILARLTTRTRSWGVSARAILGARTPRRSRHSSAITTRRSGNRRTHTATFPGGFLVIYFSRPPLRARGSAAGQFVNRIYSANPFDAQGSRYFRHFTDNAATDELHAMINGLTAAISNFNAVVSSADSLYPSLPAASQPHLTTSCASPRASCCRPTFFARAEPGCCENPEWQCRKENWLVSLKRSCHARPAEQFHSRSN